MNQYTGPISAENWVIMTIKKIIDGEKINWLQVTIIELLSPSMYIVGDKTGIAVMEIPQEFSKYLEVGKGIKLVRPSKLDDDLISFDKKFSPMKTKAVKVVSHDVKKITALKNKMMKIKDVEKQSDSKQFKDIENAVDNTIIDKML